MKGTFLFVFLSALSLSLASGADKSASGLLSGKMREMTRTERAVTYVCYFRSLSFNQIKSAYVALPENGPELNEAAGSTYRMVPNLLSARVSVPHTAGLFLVDGKGINIDLIASRIELPFKMTYAESALTWGLKIDKTALPKELNGNAMKLLGTLFNLSAGGIHRDSDMYDADCFLPESRGTVHPFLRVVFVVDQPEALVLIGIKGSEVRPVALEESTEKAWSDGLRELSKIK
jgi:hypothetical protein